MKFTDYLRLTFGVVLVIAAFAVNNLLQQLWVSQLSTQIGFSDTSQQAFGVEYAQVIVFLVSVFLIGVAALLVSPVFKIWFVQIAKGLNPQADGTSPTQFEDKESTDA